MRGIPRLGLRVLLGWLGCASALGGMLALCRQFGVVPSLECISRVEHSGPAEVRSSSARPALITPPKLTPTGPVPTAMFA